MKPLKSLFAFILATNVVIICSAQGSFRLPYDSLTGKVTFMEIVEVDSLTKDQIFNLVNEWFAKTYSKSTEVIQLADKENGKIIGKGNAIIPVQMSSFDYRHTITVDIKDHRYRCTITDLYRLPVPGLAGENIEPYITKYEKFGAGTNKRLDIFERSVANTFNGVLLSLKNFLKEKPKADKEW